MTLCSQFPIRLFPGSHCALLSCSWMLICRGVGILTLPCYDTILLPVLHVVLTVDPTPKLQTADLNSPGKVRKVGGTSRLQISSISSYSTNITAVYLCVDRDGVDNVARVVEDGHLAKHELLLHAVVQNNLLTQSRIRIGTT